MRRKILKLIIVSIGMASLLIAENLSIPAIGDKFPEMEVQTTHGKIKLPDYFKGKWFVLFSHPADFTPVCTSEFTSFQLHYKDFKKLNCELIGLSVDQVFSHIQWVRWIKDNIKVNGKPIEIKFPIIADESGEVAKKLGLLHPAKGTNTVRGVFIVDPEGIIRAILYYPQELGRNIEEILRIVKALQVSDRYNVAMPANWPNNELIGNKVIIPPATSEKQAKQNEKKYKEGYDWWFRYSDVKELKPVKKK